MLVRPLCCGVFYSSTKLQVQFAIVEQVRMAHATGSAAGIGMHIVLIHYEHELYADSTSKRRSSVPRKPSVIFFLVLVLLGALHPPSLGRVGGR